MAKKSSKAILAILKKIGVTIEDQAKVEEALDDLELNAEEFLRDDQVLLTHVEHRELKDDLTALRRRAKTAESERDEYKEAAEGGNSLVEAKAQRLQKRVDELEPVFKVLESQWSAAAASIPESLKARFAFGDTNTPLTTDQILQNVSKLQEYRELGIIKAGEPAPAPDPTKPNPSPSIPTPNPSPKPDAKLTPEQLAAMPAAEKIEKGYAYKTQ